MNLMRRNKGTVWALAGACLLMVAIGAAGASGAVEGTVRTAAPPWLSLFAVTMKSDGSIYIVGSKALFMVSTDHGKTWLQRTLPERPGSPLFQDRDLYSIRFTPDGKTGWICGEEGIILHTADGGETWTRQESTVKSNLFKLYVVDDKTAYAVGANATALRTVDGGDHWQSAKIPKAIDLFDITFSDKNTGWAVGEFSTILKTVDGGQTWQVQSGGNMAEYTIGPFFTITFTDPQHGIAAGLSGDLGITSDGGNTWQAAKLPDSSATYTVAEDAARKKLWAGGTGGKMFRQNSRGQWQEVKQITFRDITDIAFVGNEGVAVGLNGTILLTSNAGEQWQAVQ